MLLKEKKKVDSRRQKYVYKDTTASRSWHKIMHTDHQKDQSLVRPWIFGKRFTEYEKFSARSAEYVKSN